MIIEQTGLNGMTSDLAHLDESAEKLGFVRWQWEYNRATYDLKLEDRASGEDYFLRISTRAVEGKLENPDADPVHRIRLHRQGNVPARTRLRIADSRTDPEYGQRSG